MKWYRHAGINPPLYHTIKASELSLAQSQEPAIKELQKELEDDFQSLASNLIVLGKDGDDDRHIPLDSEEQISTAGLITRMIATIQSGRYIQQWPPWGRIAGFALIVLIAGILYRLRRGQVIIRGTFLLFLYLGAHILIFKTSLLWTPPLAPLVLFAILILIGTILPPTPLPGHSTDPAEDAKQPGKQT